MIIHVKLRFACSYTFHKERGESFYNEMLPDVVEDLQRPAPNVMDATFLPALLISFIHNFGTIHGICIHCIETM